VILFSKNHFRATVVPMKLYPLFTDLTDKAVLVVGGGLVAQHKIAALLDARARVTVIAPQITLVLQSWSDENRLILHRRPYQPADLTGVWLVIAATDDPGVNRQIKGDCDTGRIFCNVVDVPALCSFQVPAVIARGDLQFAISTGGACPFLAKYLKDYYDRLLPEQLDQLVATLEKLRRHWQTQYPDDAAARQAALNAFLACGAIEAFLQENYSEFQRLITPFLDSN